MLDHDPIAVAPEPLPTPLAIIGMACCLPGARNLQEFWELLRAGRSAIGPLPADRLDDSLYFDPQPGHRGKTYSRLGGVIPERMLPLLSQVLPLDEYSRSDVCHRILCDVALEACVHAGYDIRRFPWRNTGVYVGHSGGSPLGGDLAFGTLAEETLDYLNDVPDFAAIDVDLAAAILKTASERLRRRRPRRDARGGPDVEASFATSWIARALRLNGPHFVIDAACASSLVALVAAATALQDEQIDAAIVGGASFNKCDSLILFSQARSCSALGSRPFDDRADGLISSEGYAALLLKLLPRAIADGDRIQAVIRGFGMSSDGRGRSLWAPRQEGQVAAVRRAYESGADPGRVQFIEAHATSTQVGDATELAALSSFFGPHVHGEKIALGSVKSNIGHTLETAGLAGLLKAVLAIQHAEIPPTINLEQLNQNVDWDQMPFVVPTEATPWPQVEAGQPRCAAVNAFGIGGLNVHVVVEEHFQEKPPVQRSPANVANGASRVGGDTSTAKPRIPIAVLGRGVILPGACSVQEFAELLRSGRCAVGEAPDSRRRSPRGRYPVNSTQPWQLTSRGGYLRDYSYDWRTHKIPPKQIAQANPLQFLLLDAVHAALVEAGYDQKPFDNERTGVVVGTVFGGEFGNDLQVGLRLPEIRQELACLLADAGWSQQRIHDLLDEYERRLLQARPALLDETGSFTCSTLASRIAKTHNWMGGAMAIDAGECSSLAALSLSCDLLRSNLCATVLCAAAQRSLDLPAFEVFALRGKRADSQQNGDGSYPGEGVVAVLLKRLDDAERDGDRVLGIIDGIGGASEDRDSRTAIRLAGQRAGLAGELQPQHDRQLIRQIGDTQAVHGLAMLVQSTLDESSANAALSIGTKSHSGLAYQLAFSRGPRATSNPPNSARIPSVPAEGPTTERWSDSSLAQVVEQVRHALRTAPSSRSHRQIPFHDGASARLAIVSSSPDELTAKRSLVVRTNLDASCQTMLSEQGIYFSSRSGDAPPRIAFAFPGQGSQYPGMLRNFLSLSSAAARAVEEMDADLRSLGFDSVETLLWTESSGSSSIWRTQIAMLLADYLALHVAREWGIGADCVVGHSYGEFAALVAAESLTLREAISLTRFRAATIESAVTVPGAMLSLNASLTTVQTLLAQHAGNVCLSHHNAPEQTVVGGLPDSVLAFDAFVTSRGITTRRLNVPAAMHTDLMRPALDAWRESLRSAVIRPPRIPLISSVTNKYVADPEEIRHNLELQLVTPVRYADLVTRLASDGMDIILELGPQQVLTRLHRRTLEHCQVTCLAIDHASRSAQEQRCRVLAELECQGWQPGGGESSANRRDPNQAIRQLVAVEHFDATAVRRARRHSDGESKANRKRSTAVEPVEQFDATRQRRDTRQAAAGGSANTIEKTVPGHSAPPIASDAATRILVDFVVEQTGYPTDLIDLDWDLEADLGIDSIKRAQLFGELRQVFGLDTSDPKSLEQYRTLRQIAELIGASVRGTVVREPAIPNVADRQITVSGTSKLLGTDDTTVRGANSADMSALERMLIAFVVDQTGYPADVIELDADFEADLGLDSIKKTQLLGELREHFRWQDGDQESFSGDAFRTLRQVRDWVAARVEQPASPGQVSTSVPTVGGGMDRHEASGNGESNLDAARYSLGVNRGRQHAAAVRARLCRVADSYLGSPADPQRSPIDRSAYALGEWSELCGLANGAGVPVETVLGYLGATGDPDGLILPQVSPHEWEQPKIERGTDATVIRSSVTNRYVLRMARASRRPGLASGTIGNGAAVILGDNAAAQAICRRLKREGQRAHVVCAADDPADSIRELDRIWRTEPVPHLFLVTPRDESAVTDWDGRGFAKRRQCGVSTLYWFCQRWFTLATEANLLDRASIVGLTALGGDFGFGGGVTAVESGAMTGLLKSIIIESWVNGHRTIPIKIIDSPNDMPFDQLVDGIWGELAAPSYDVEIGLRDGERWVVRAHRQDIDELPRRAIPRGGNWVCTGGARGITAFAARELALRFGLRLHLLGLSPSPQVPDSWRELSSQSLQQLKIEVMQSARAAGKNAVKEWEKVEKALEIDRTLRDLHECGVPAEYHPCDVSDPVQLRNVLEAIRRQDGPIEGILHGAGIGKDARFDRKEKHRVEECIRAKVDGARALMELTRHDPLRYFVAFGSISGRFGANGHTDYSLANDMLCKQMDWFRRQRPDVKAVGFHWHAWGDVGMATKPETQLALEMVGMQFMPAQEGIVHLIGELQSESGDTEILITDDRYYRLFYPAETLVPSHARGNGHSPRGSLLRTAHTMRGSDEWLASIELNPLQEPFLREHRLDDQPILPIVVGMELISEAAAHFGNGAWRGALRNVEAVRGLRFYNNRPIEVRVRVKPCADGRNLYCELLADFRSRDGRIIESNRCYLRGEIHSSDSDLATANRLGSISWDGLQAVQYAGRGSKMYLGHPLQCLRGIRTDRDTAWGRVVAPALVELAGAHRSVEDWLVPSAALDACLYATGLLCWSHVAPGATLPVRFGGIDLGRLPYPGEGCVVETRFVGREAKTAVFEFTLFGADGSPLIRATDYHVAWIAN